MWTLDIYDIVSSDFTDLLVKLTAALFAGFVLGLDRELKGYSAGLRTHMLVALSAAATAVIALQLHHDLIRAHPNSNADPLRIIEGLITAVGFLGGGIIIRSAGRIRGLTTVANLWACGVIGLAFGAGLFRIGFVTLALNYVVLAVLLRVERRMSAGESPAAKK